VPDIPIPIFYFAFYLVCQHFGAGETSRMSEAVLRICAEVSGYKPPESSAISICCSWSGNSVDIFCCLGFTLPASALVSKIACHAFETPK